MTLVLEPIFEADLGPEAFGYRPRRSATDAVRRVALIKMWLKAPVEERTGTGGKRLTGGKGSKSGTPRRGEAHLRHDARRSWPTST